MPPPSAATRNIGRTVIVRDPLDTSCPQSAVAVTQGLNTVVKSRRSVSGRCGRGRIGALPEAVPRP